MMPQTRISQDVWELGRQIAEAKGLKNERQAIEAVVRVFGKQYLQGMQPIESSPVSPVPAAAQPASAQDALASVLSNL